MVLQNDTLAPDSQAPHLTGLELPQVIDLSNGPVSLSIGSFAEDDLSQIKELILWFDRPIAFGFGATTTLNSYSFLPNYGYSDDWADGYSGQVYTFSDSNEPGIYSISRVTILDTAGNSRLYQPDELQQMGIATEIEFIGGMQDDTPPVLHSLDIPSWIDLSMGATTTTLSASASDNQSGVRSVEIWLDGDISYSYGTSLNSAYPGPLIMILGGSTDWQDGSHTQSITLSPDTAPGFYTISQVKVNDVIGNSRTYTQAELAQMGMITEIDIVGPPATPDGPYARVAADQPIAVTEGTSRTIALSFENLTDSQITYSYEFSIGAGSASWSDFSGGSDSGSIAVRSTSPTSRQVDIDFEAVSDLLTEGVEYVDLIVTLKGLGFADGTSRKTFQISILDNLRPTGSAVVVLDGVASADVSDVTDPDGLSLQGPLDGHYQWLRDGQPIEGADQVSYRPGPEDEGRQLSFVYSYIDDAGVSESITSEAITLPRTNKAPTGAVQLSGSAQLGGTLTVLTDDVDDADGVGALHYQWMRDGTPISSATDRSYVLTAVDVGAEISAQISYVDGYGTHEALSSPELRVISPTASSNADYLLGTPAADSIVGGAGSDTLIGGAGDDILIGGTVAPAADAAGARIYRIYQATLGRMPDTVGHKDWSRLLENGWSVERIIAGFVESPEFQTTYGPLDNADFVELLYQNVLGRTADAAGLAGWTARLDNGQQRASVVTGFSESAEFRTKTIIPASAYVATELSVGDHLDDVFRLYRATLDRVPDLAGLESWSQLLAKGTDYITIASGFVNSPEFHKVYGPLDNTGFVTQLYQNVLGRAPDAAGLEGWTARLEAGTSRAEVVRGFAQSNEFIAKTQSDFAAFIADAKGDRLEGGAGDDLLMGSLWADHFIFDAAQTGHDRVLGLDQTDRIELRGFGFEDSADALTHFRQVGSDTLFTAGDISIVFADTALQEFNHIELLV